jgi:hypothetical protein
MTHDDLIVVLHSRLPQTYEELYGTYEQYLGEEMWTRILRLNGVWTETFHTISVQILLHLKRVLML